MKVEWFNYDLPKSKIAQAPVRPRERAKMMVIDKAKDLVLDQTVADLPSFLQAGDLLVFNVSKVSHARIFGWRQAGENKIETEVLVLKPLNMDGKFECLLKGKRINVGEKISFSTLPGLRPPSPGQERRQEKNPSPLEEKVPVRRMRREVDDINALITNKLTDGMGRFVLQTNLNSSEFIQFCESTGKLPLPPYINNPNLVGFEDELYQPITAKKLGSVAAPTASLHFSPELLEKIKFAGVQTTEVILHVGLGTFLPVRVEDTKDHVMHFEYVEVDQEVINKIIQTKQAGKRVIAVGTTVARALESSNLNPYFGETNLFITPGYKFKVIDGLLTNFHQPKSTLLMLVSALIGREKQMMLYERALKNNYRFLSFGDCMLILGD